jgi:MFS family permease
MARIGGFVYLMFALSSLVVGKLTDRWIAAGASFDIRKKLSAAGKVGMGIFLILSAMAPDTLYVWTLALVGVCMGLAACNIWAVSQTLAGPNMVGRWTGVQNFGGNLAGAVAPWLTGFLLDRTGHFYWAFFITAAITWVGALSWIHVVGPVQEVNWNCRGPLVVAARAAQEPSRP